MRKRKLLTAAVVLAAVLLIALILFLSGRKTQEERFTGGADTLYPYAWTEAKNGTVLVEPCGEIPAGFGWTIAEADAAVIAVSPQDLEGRQAFLLTPVGAGDCFCILSLAGTEEGEEELGRLVMTLEVTGGKRLKAAVAGHRLEIPEGVLQGGESFGAAYRIWTGEDGSLELRLADTDGAEDWKLSVLTPSTLELSAFRTEAGRVSAELYSPASGDVAFVLFSQARGLSLEVSGRADGERDIRASAHEMKQHAEWADKDEGYADADLLAGAAAAPEGAEDVRYSAASLGAGIGAVSCMEFRYLGADWTLYTAASGGISGLLEKEFPEEELKTFFIPAGLLIAAFEEDSVFAWCDTEDGAYLLEGSGEGIGRETLLQTASEVIVTDADAAQEDAKNEA